MKHLLLILSFFTIISCSKVKPEGAIETHEVKIADFNQLNLKGKFRVFYIHSQKNFVSVETNPNFYKNLDINVEDNILNIHEKRETQGLDFYNISIYSKDNLNQVKLSDSVEFNISGEINSPDFKLNLKNDAKFIGAVNSKNLNLEMVDKSRANLLGKTDNAFIKISDTASLIAPYWYIKDLNINSDKGNYSELNVDGKISGEVKNTATFNYYGSPISAFKIEKTATVENKKLN
ncbi:GIN domain-containing protein [Halpernia sp.]|uniref:GIN domain-containing protein n=1 Tax=Halpernia sp. TaxID=2782209 RepID=UPI003A941BB1